MNNRLAFDNQMWQRNTLFKSLAQLQAASESSLQTLSHFGKYLNLALGLCVLSEKEFAMNGALNEKLKR